MKKSIMHGFVDELRKLALLPSQSTSKKPISRMLPTPPPTPAAAPPGAATNAGRGQEGPLGMA